jgi:hypothetical protein
MTTSSIKKQMEKICAEELGKHYKPLSFKLDHEINDDRSLIGGYAVIEGSGEQEFRVDQGLTINKTFKIKLTRRAFTRDSDSAIDQSIDDISNSIDGIIRRLCSNRMEMQGRVQRCVLTEWPEPAAIGEQRDIAYVQLSFRVRYFI